MQLLYNRLKCFKLVKNVPVLLVCLNPFKGVSMKTVIVCFSFLVLSSAFAADYYLKPEDQKFFKNDSMEGKNQLERIDANVKEINKMYGEMSLMKTEITNLKREIEDLKKK